MNEWIESTQKEYSYFEGLSIFEYCVIDPSWESLFNDLREYLVDINDVLEKDVKNNGDFFPEKANIFKAFQLTPLTNIKIVILGQDPYPGRHSCTGRSRAQGLSFSVDSQDQIPSSLCNVYKEIFDDLTGWVVPNHGDLTSWTSQGVLLLNSALTVRPDTPDSHPIIWNGIIVSILQEIQKRCPHVVFVLWGRKAQDMQIHLKDKTKRMCAGHPSGRNATGGFFGCKHFSKINKYLKSKGFTEIDWTIPNVVIE